MYINIFSKTGFKCFIFRKLILHEAHETMACTADVYVFFYIILGVVKEEY